MEEAFGRIGFPAIAEIQDQADQQKRQEINGMKPHAGTHKSRCVPRDCPEDVSKLFHLAT